MIENYGRRKDDFMPIDEITPDILASLNDSQKTHIRILQNITSINTALNDMQHDVSVHNKLLITGNGELPIPERLRNAERFIATTNYWGRFIGGALVVQTIAFFIGILIAIVRFLPVLERLAAQP
jgi:hypothetical protein